MHGDRDGDKEADGSEVAERQDLISRNQYRYQNRQRNKDQAGRDNGGMAEQQRRIQTNQEFLPSEAGLKTATGMACNGR